MIPKSPKLTSEFPVMEHFFTIQGEGYYSGRAAYFIRLAGCDVGCVWCDVKESWDAGKHEIQTVESLIAEVKKSNTDFCVITGAPHFNATPKINLLSATVAATPPVESQLHEFFFFNNI